MADVNYINVILNLLAVLGTGGLLGVLLSHRRGMYGAMDTELKRLAGRLDIAEKNYRDCEERERLLRVRITDLEDEVTGLKRQIARYSADQAVLLDRKDALSFGAESAKRVRHHTSGPGPHDPDDSEMLSIAKDTVTDARQTLNTAKDACEEVLRSEMPK